MTTASYPLTGATGAPQNFTGNQWRGVFNDGSDGVIGSDGTAVLSGDLVRTAVSDVATIKAGVRFRYRGEVCEVTADHGMTLAAVTGSAKTYSIGLMFDPAAEGTSPVSLYSALKTAISIPSGGSFKTLYEVTRSPSQTLDLATVADFRAFVGPRLWVPGGTLPSDSPLGTFAYDGTSEFARVRNTAKTAAQWNNLDDPPWMNLSLNGTWLAVAGFPAQARLRRSKVEIEGVIRSGASGITQAAITLPTGLRPSVGRFLGAHTASRGTSGTAFELQVNSVGVLTIDATYHEGGALLPSTNYPISGSFPV